MNEEKKEEISAELHQQRVKDFLKKVDEFSQLVERGEQLPANRLIIETSLLPDIVKSLEFDPLHFTEEDIVSVNEITVGKTYVLDVLWKIKNKENAFLRRTYEEKVKNGEIEKKTLCAIDFRPARDVESNRQKPEQRQAIKKYFEEHQKNLAAEDPEKYRNLFFKSKL